ncbi:hypothetical protein CSHISOI_10560 [Colletotrichum shisoi]|uniref:Uncharacterized protein n=1 Tax=Colletotrichum shisoi TaxID=2078593 RepID=A0A5Q4BDT9_9PEZI|nr:hypothetical protein CSHISOI_10560 [Colletotrichum shisoi]
MLWAITLLLTLASCFASSQPLVQERGRICFGSRCWGKFKPPPPPSPLPKRFSLKNPKELIDLYIYRGNKQPSLKKLPLTLWDGSTIERRMTYRAWGIEDLPELKTHRTKNSEGRFTVFLEVQVSGEENLYVTFIGRALIPVKRIDTKTAKWVKSEDPWESFTSGLVLQSGKSPYPRRVVFQIKMPTYVVHEDSIKYTINGKWSKSSLHTPVL